MDNFDLTKFLAEGKLHEAMSPQDIVDIADTVAEEFTKESADEGDFMIYSVGEMDVDDMTFELDTDTTAQTPERILKMSNLGVGEGWGGSFRINPKEEGYEVRNSEKGGLVAIIDGMGNFKMISADESRAEMGMADGEKTDFMQRRKETDDYMEENDKLNPGMYIDDEEWEKEMGRMEEGEAPKSNKMKKSELKEMIKAAMLAETKISEDVDMIPAEKLFALISRDLQFSPLVQDGAMLTKEQAIEIMGHVIAIEQSDISPEAALGEYIANGEFEEAGDIPGFEGTMDALDSLSIREEEEEDVEDVEIDTEEEVDVDVDMDMGSETDGIDVKQDADTDLGGTVGDVQDNLEAALEAARALGDEKLEDQIGNTLTFFTRTHVVKEDILQDEAEMGLEEALNKPVGKLGPDVEKRLQSMGFETKVFPNPTWGNIPNEAIDAIEANPKLAGIAFVNNQSGSEAMRVMVNAERKKDLQKLRDYFQVPEEEFGPAKELSWVTKQIQNVNPGDWVASQAKVLDSVAVIDWFRLTTKGASKTTDAGGNTKMDFGQAAESLNESVFPVWNKIK